MTARARPEHHEETAAIRALADRYCLRYPNVCDALDRVASEAVRAKDRPGVATPPPLPMLLAGLAVIDAAADVREWQELTLIDVARGCGASWAQIGTAMGFRSGYKQGARARYDRLRAKFPGFTPTVKEGPHAEGSAGQNQGESSAATHPRAGAGVDR